MRRRDLFAGLAAAGAGAAAGPQRESGTLYIPPVQRVEDLDLLHDTMEEYPFVELVTVTPALRITHLPVWLDRKAGEYGTLYGHIARQNPQSAAIESRSPAVMVFRGPHAYISPSWYGNPKSVPTWNFAAVHVSGKPEPVTEERALYDLLATLIARSEGGYGGGEYDFSQLPRSYIGSMMKGIAGFRLRIEAIEGKFKLGQERSEADREGVVRHLKAAAGERTVADFTAAFYRRKPSAAGRR
jgi:transcriptional regulator